MSISTVTTDNQLKILQQLWDIEQIKKLKARYFRLLDEKKFDEWGDTLTEDCYMDSEDAWSGPTSTRYKFQGRKNIVEASRGPSGFYIHQGHMPEIDIIDDTSAKGIWTIDDYSVLLATNSIFHGWGIYADEYQRCTDGQWRISKTSVSWFHVERLSWNGRPV